MARELGRSSTNLIERRYGHLLTSRRTRKMGSRIALGAQPADVLRLVVKQGLTRIAVGPAVGPVFAALIISRGLEVVLFGMEPWAPGSSP